MNRVSVLQHCAGAARETATTNTTQIRVVGAHFRAGEFHAAALRKAGSNAAILSVLQTATADEQAQAGITPGELAAIMALISAIIAAKNTTAPSMASTV